MKTGTRVFGWAGILVMLAVCVWADPIVTNGDFESVQIGPPFHSSNPADVPGWAHQGDVGDGLLWAVGYSDPNGSIAVAGHGNQFVTLGGGVNDVGTGSWSQMVSGFTVGALYDLRFDIAAEDTGDIQTIVALVKGIGATTAPFTAVGSGGNYWRDWQAEGLSFTADSTTETISFSSTTEHDIGLDDVRITSAVPEPSSAVLLALAIGAGLLIRRRSHRAPGVDAP